jgi:hypothetical protein
VKKRIVVAAACTAALASLALATPANAAWSPLSFGKTSTIANGLFTPLSMAVDATGNSWVSQNFIGTLTKITPSGKQTTAVTAPPGDEIGAVSSRSGTVYFSQGSQPEARFSMMSLSPGGTPTEVADIGAYEATVNPDQVNTYGFTDLDEKCLAEFDPAGPFGPPVYTGVVDTHVYASAATGNALYVADAGGNAILRVGYDGTVSTVAVLPPTAPVTLTPEMVAQFGFPECAGGAGYAFEPVPTDIEVGPDGWLYVTSLPGGPEDASLGMRGSVLKVNPGTGEIRTVATGFVGSTGLAVEKNTGIILVAELFGGANGTGQVSVLLPGKSKASTSIPVTSPAAVELRNGKVYVTRNAFVPDEMGAPQPIGSVTVVSLTGASRLFDSMNG